MIEVFGFVNVWMLFMLFIFCLGCFYFEFFIISYSRYFLIYTDDQKNMPFTPFYY